MSVPKILIGAALVLRGIHITIHEVREFLKESDERKTKDEFIKLLEEKKW